MTGDRRQRTEDRATEQKKKEETDDPPVELPHVVVISPETAKKVLASSRRPDTKFVGSLVHSLLRSDLLQPIIELEDTAAVDTGALPKRRGFASVRPTSRLV